MDLTIQDHPEYQRQVASPIPFLWHTGLHSVWHHLLMPFSKISSTFSWIHSETVPPPPSPPSLWLRERWMFLSPFLSTLSTRYSQLSDRSVVLRATPAIPHNSTSQQFLNTERLHAERVHRPADSSERPVWQHTHACSVYLEKVAHPGITAKIHLKIIHEGPWPESPSE